MSPFGTCPCHPPAVGSSSDVEGCVHDRGLEADDHGCPGGEEDCAEDCAEAGSPGGDEDCEVVGCGGGSLEDSSEADWPHGCADGWLPDCLDAFLRGSCSDALGDHCWGPGGHVVCPEHLDAR
mmetsp:Transcript_115196/g.215748  ORF Transcript_115196/g.215748 Transcript_115196/m.215748 type:complete len:123 (-) Transcript_115196:926-1294(-)